MMGATGPSKGFISYMLALIACALLSLTVIPVALCRPFRLERLPDKGDNFGCATCHAVVGGKRNPFGQDYEGVAIKAGDRYTEDLGKMDSDGDGFTNDEEFAANTHPGKPESKPEGRRPESQKAGKPASWSSGFRNWGQFLALAGSVLILFQYVLSSRMRLIERGVGLDKLFSVHRKLGVLGLTLVFFHPILLFVSSGLQGYNLPLKIVGTFALLILLVAAGAAILYAKLRLKYETWKNIHRAGYVIFPLGFVHSFFLGSHLREWSPIRILWLVLASIYVAVLVYRAWNWSYVRRQPFRVAEVLRETHDTWSLYFEGKHRDYKPGQFMIIQLVRDGKVSEPHPFTISSSPTGDRLSVSVKSVGDFTSTIGNTKFSDTAYIDAPYGRFSFLNHDAHDLGSPSARRKKESDLVFIAGGIGITPFMSMLRYIYDRKLDRNVLLMWANKTEADIAFREELEKMAAQMPSLRVVHVMSKQDDWPGEKGFIDVEKLKTHVSNFQESQFFICGPPPMMIAVERDLRDLGVPKKRIHYERFALR